MYFSLLTQREQMLRHRREWAEKIMENVKWKNRLDKDESEIKHIEEKVMYLPMYDCACMLLYAIIYYNYTLPLYVIIY